MHGDRDSSTKLTWTLAWVSSHDTWLPLDLFNYTFMLHIQCHVTALDLSMFKDMVLSAMCQTYFILPHVTWQAAMLVSCILY